MSDSPRRSGNKVGSNKGIARREHERRRAEAEERNARTPEERTRIFREGPVGKRGGS
jgi:hypothetical protein